MVSVHNSEVNEVTNDQYIHSNASKASQIVYGAVVGAFVEKAFEGSALSLLAVLL